MVAIPLLAQLSAAILVSRTPAAGDCPDTEHLTAEVERIVARPLARRDAGPRALVVRADFSRIGGSYEAKLELSGARAGERVLRDEGTTCGALAEAVAVTTALLVDPSSQPKAAPAPGGSSERARPWLGWWLGARFGAGVGLVGGSTWMAALGLEASLGSLTIVDLAAGVSGPYANELGVGRVKMQLWYASVGAFRSLTGEQIQAGPFVQLMGGALRGVAQGYPQSSSASLAWFAVGAGLRFEAHWGPALRIGARAFALVPTRKESFSIGYVGTAHESSSVAGVAELALAVKIW